MKIDYQSRVQEIDLIYDELDFHLNYFDERNGAQHATYKVDMALPRKIEKFIAHLISSKSPLFRLKPNGHYEPTSWAREFSPFDFILKRSPQNIYQDHPLVEVFLKLLDKWIIEHNSLPNKQMIPYENQFDVSADRLQHHSCEYLNYFAEIVRREFQTDSLKNEFSLISNAVNRKLKVYCTYIDELIELHEPLTCMCLEFSLAAPVEGQSIHTLKKSFFNNGRSTRAFSGLVGHFEKWEFSFSKREYFRVVFIFQTSTVINLKALSDQIADYWVEEITNGTGECHQAKLAAKTQQLKKLSCVIQKGDKKNSRLIQGACCCIHHKV